MEDDPPVADDDFPEFAGPPQHKPGPGHHARQKPEPEPESSDAQAAADDLIARLRRERAEGKR
ncbi:MAG: hypothetical protein ACJ716_06520 [Marmoricola sp.]